MDKNSRPWWRHPDLGQRREIDLPQGTVNCYDAGSGQPIVFLHGPFTNANEYCKVVPLLSGKFRCLTLELPLGAHEHPMPKATLTLPGLAHIVADAIEALGLRDVILVGNSGGTAIAQIVATQRPERLSHLVLASGSSYDNAPPKKYRFMFFLVSRLGTRIMFGSLRIPLLRRLPFAFGWMIKHPVDRATSDTFVWPSLVTAGVGADASRLFRVSNPRYVYSLEAAKHFSEFKKPVLVAWSVEDKIFPPAHAVRLVRDFPNARLEWIEDSYALSSLDQPEKLAALIADFIVEDVARASAR
ncbi:alpha/beta fold hydrolase [Nocardia pseudovaccinii]|uniref:alpha/beta fold hydrolase n=1 Tax=Nocardia pseudovaccinii TaxID=189540 RepID=UPI0007A494F2|nr:alpha/beta hydrolase [Nocardia pseudovaccinii]